MFAALLSGLSLIGCDRMSAATSASGLQVVAELANSDDKPRTLWDCGVVFPGEVTRVSFAIDLPDVSSIADISNVETSCQCTQVSLRDMHVRGEEFVVACITIDRSDETHSDREHKLLVSVSIATIKGVRHEADINVTLM